MLACLSMGCVTGSAPSPPSPPPKALPAPPTPAPLLLPDALAQRLTRAANQLRSGDPQALAALEGLEKDAATSAVLSEQLAALYEEINFTDQTYRLAQQAVRLDPKEVDALVRLSRTEQYLGYFSLAKHHLEEAVGLAPGSADVQLALSLFYQHHEHHPMLPEAEAALKKAIALTPGEWRLYLLLNQLLVTEKKPEEALQVLEQATPIAPDPAQISLQRAFTLDALGRRREAIPLAEAAVKALPDSENASYYLGKFLEAEGNLAGARLAWEQTYQKAPDYPNLRPQLARLRIRQNEKERGTQLLAEEKKKADQSSHYQRLVTLVAQEPENLQQRRQLAHYCTSRHLLTRALLEWDQILERKPADPEARREQAALRRRRREELTHEP